MSTWVLRRSWVLPLPRMLAPKTWSILLPIITISTISTIISTMTSTVMFRTPLLACPPVAPLLSTLMTLFNFFTPGIFEISADLSIVAALINESVFLGTSSLLASSCHVISPTGRCWVRKSPRMSHKLLPCLTSQISKIGPALLSIVIPTQTFAIKITAMSSFFPAHLPWTVPLDGIRSSFHV